MFIMIRSGIHTTVADPVLKNGNIFEPLQTPFQFLNASVAA